MEGDNTTILIVVGVVLALLLLGWLLMRRRRTDTLREHFGDEYQRTVDTQGGRAKAEAELLEREKRAKKLEIRPLTPDENERFSGDWQAAKALFVDSPAEAIGRSDQLLADLMKTRGYPMGDFDSRHANLTVEHGDVAKHYLAGHEIAERAKTGEASTEELRQAMQHYEALFTDLVSDVKANDENPPVSDRAPSSTS